MSHHPILRTLHRCWHGLALAGLAALPLSLAAQGVAYVSSEKDDTLTILDMKTLTVTGTLATCKQPRHLALTPDRKQLLVACTDSPMPPT